MPYLMLHCCPLLLFCIIVIIMLIPFNELVQGHSGRLEMVQFHNYHQSQVHWCIRSNKVESYKMQNCTLIAWSDTQCFDNDMKTWQLQLSPLLVALLNSCFFQTSDCWSKRVSWHTKSFASASSICTPMAYDYIEHIVNSCNSYSMFVSVCITWLLWTVLWITKSSQFARSVGAHDCTRITCSYVAYFT
jgi:hypothetical protein